MSPRLGLLLSLPLVALALMACKVDTERAAVLHPLRLGDAVVPIAQELALEIDPGKDGYSGRTSIRIDIREATDSLRLHGEGLTIVEAGLEKEGATHSLKAAPGPAGLLILRAEKSLRPGAATLRIGFTQAYNTQSISLYKVKAGGGNHVFTQFEAWDARKAFPCFDEPGFKIPWTVSVRVPSSLLAVSNYPVVLDSAEPAPAGAGATGVASASTRWKTVAFATSKPMPSYLVALAVGDFDTVSIPGMSVPGKVVTLKGQGHLARQAVAMAPPLLKALEEYFGKTCPYPKLDLISVPEFMFGAMENPGAITFRENIILFDSVDATLRRQRGLASIMAHEMAHLWFGDLVTMSWWDDLWLNESFASWMGDRTVDRAFPHFRIDMHGVPDRQWAMMLDGMHTARAIRTTIAPTDNPIQSFDGLAYSKGQEVLGMLEAWMGEEAFRNGVKRYVEEYSWKNAEAGDLWAHLSESAGRNLAPVMADFLDRPGVPMVEMEMRGKKALLKQRRFFLSGSPDTVAQPWKIPMVLRCLDQGKEHRLPVLFEDRATEITTDFGRDGMVCHPNQEERGYYRWNLTTAGMEALAAKSSEALSERERVAFLGNLSALSEAGLIRADALLDRLRPFAGDSSPQVQQALLDVLEDVEERFVDSRTESAFARYVQSLLRPTLDRLGWRALASEDDRIPELRSRLMKTLAETGKDDRAGRMADSLAALFLKDREKVDPSLAQMSLTVSASRGGISLFRLYRREFERAASPVLRSNFLSALGSFRDTLVADSALAYALRGPLRPHEFMSISRILGGRREHRDRNLAWVIANRETILKRVSPIFAVYLPWNGSYSMESWTRAKAIFLELDSRIPGLAKEMEKVEEAVRHLENLRARDGESVRAYLMKLST